MRRKPYDGPVSDHFDGSRFFVPGHNADKSRADLLRWTFGEKRAPWPRNLPSPFAATPAKRVLGLRSTLIGHASFLLQTAGLNILIDPLFSRRASPVVFAGPKRVNPPGIAFDDLPPIDAVLLTHNHYDHFDMATLHQVEERWHPLFIGPLGIDHSLSPARRWPQNMKVLDWGQNVALAALNVHAVPTYHWSARGLRDRRKTLWCSFVIAGGSGVVYHIGDTGYGAGAFSRQVARDFGEIALAHIPIGAYEPRWFMKDYHVNPAEAVQIFQDCAAREAIGHHWGTFQLTNEAHDQPTKDLAVALEKQRIAPDRFRAFQPGQVWEQA